MSLKNVLRIALVLTATGANAGTVIWTGAAGVRDDGTYAWCDPLNWDGGVLPGEGDVAQIQNVDGAPDPMRISLDGGTQTIGQLRYQGKGGVPKAFVENGTLRLAQGHVTGIMDGTYGIKANLEQLVDGNWRNTDSWGKNLHFFGGIRGEGAIVFDGNQNNNARFEGATVSVPKITFRANSLEMLAHTWLLGTTVEVNGGFADGNFNGTSLRINLSGDADLSAEDALVFREEASLAFAGSGGAFTYTRPNVAVDQRFALALNGGRCNVTITGGTAAGNYLTVTNFSRVGGTYMAVNGSGLRFPTLENGASGYLGAWIWNNFALPMKVDAEGALSAASDTEFTAFPADGGSPYALLRTTAENDYFLEKDTAFFWLWDTYGEDKAFHLGNHTLDAYGPLMFRWVGGAKTFDADEDGKMVFHGDDIVVSAAGNGHVEFNAPIAWDSTSSTLSYPNLVLLNGSTKSDDGVVFGGRDDIGHYGNINSALNRHRLVFAGPSNRSIHGEMQDALQIEQRGSGTLTFEETSSLATRSFSLTVTQGKVVMKSPKISVAPTVSANGVFELAEGLSVTQTPKISDGGVFQGFGTSSWGVRDGRFGAGGVIAPGNETRAGTLTMGGFKPEGNFTLVCRLDSESSGQIKVTKGNKMTLPQTGSVTGTIRVDDLTAGVRRIHRSDEFVVVDYSLGSVENADKQTVNWQVETATPKFLDVSEAVVSLDKTKKQLIVSGVKSKNRALMIIVR